MNKAEKIEYLRLLEIQESRRLSNNLKHFRPYPWQQRFFAAGIGNRQRMLMAANRVGKTHSEGYEFAVHATGLYPDDWRGFRFLSAPKKMWALGVTGDQIRDVIQKELCGDDLDGGNFGRGAIPLERIIMSSIVRSPQTKGLIKEFKVKHASGRIVTIAFKAYSQGQHVMMGPSIDYIWIDEEPQDQQIYPQCLTRTLTGDDGRGGHVVLTFTPENGMTPLVCQFMDDIQEGQYLQNVTWDDAPHLTAEAKEQLLQAIPSFQRDMRTKGIPVLGSGLIYQVADDVIKVDPFECPDHWLVVNGHDFGWNHPQAIVQHWIDPDHGITYVARAWRKSEMDADQAWTATKTWAKGAPSAWPHDGLQHEKGGGEVVRKQYAQAGFEMMDSHATWPEVKGQRTGGMSVESGLWQINRDMLDGKFKVFSNLEEWFEEKRLYHRDDHGRIVKERDDLLCASRYAKMMERNAIPMASVKRIRSTSYGQHENYAMAEHDFDPYA